MCLFWIRVQDFISAAHTFFTSQKTDMSRTLHVTFTLRDAAKYLDWTHAKNVSLSNLKPSTKTISLRLPQHLLDSMKVAA